MALLANTWKEGKSEDAEETVWVLVVNFIFLKWKTWMITLLCNAILNGFKSVSFYSSNLLLP